MGKLFKARLRDWRGQRTQKLAANSLDLPLATYQNWEQGRREPPAQVQSAMLRTMQKLK